jgi:hypothetical protein
MAALIPGVSAAASLLERLSRLFAASLFTIAWLFTISLRFAVALN